MRLVDEYVLQRRLFSWQPRKRAAYMAALNTALILLTNHMAGRSRYPQWYLWLRDRKP